MSTSDGLSPTVGPDAPVDGEIVDAGDTRSEEPRDERKRSPFRRVAIGVGATLLVVLSMVVAMALWPASSSGLSAQPDATTSLDEAIARFDELTVGEDGVVWEACESKLLTQGQRTDVVVVLFHGLTNCPEQFDEFAAELHAEGANVVVLRAPHHGRANASGDAIGSVSNAGALTVRELRDFADDSIDVATGLGEEVRVLGLSMGGVLAAWTAQERDDVDRVVVVAPAMGIPGVPSMLTTAFINLFDKVPNVDLPGESKLDHAYPGGTSKGLVATFLLGRATDASARNRGPAAGEVVVVVNPDDNQVDPDTAKAFAARWAEHDGRVTMVELPFTGLPHDVVDPDQPSGNTTEVYPLLQMLLDGG